MSSSPDQDGQSSYTVWVEPAGIEIEVREGETLFDAAWRGGWDWPTICYGQARCTHCHVMLRGDATARVSPIGEPDESRMIPRVARRLYGGETAGLRLACRLRVSGDVVVEQADFSGKRRAAG